MAADLRCCAPTEQQVERLLKLIPKVSNDKRVVDWSRALLGFYVKDDNAMQFGSIARTVTMSGNVVGFFAANFVKSEHAHALVASRAKQDYWNQLLVPPLTCEEIAMLPATRGGTVVVTEFFWDLDLVQKTDFTAVAAEHIVRWFEGNRIESLVFSLYSRFRPLADAALWLTPSKERSLKKVEGRFYVAHITGPWKGESSFGNKWGERLLRSAELHRPRQTLELSNRDKFIGRVMHEYAFEMDQAAPVAWHYDELDVQKQARKQTEKYPNLKTWRDSVAGSIWGPDERQEIARRKEVLQAIEETFIAEPWRLVPRSPGET